MEAPGGQELSGSKMRGRVAEAPGPPQPARLTGTGPPRSLLVPHHDSGRHSGVLGETIPSGALLGNRGAALGPLLAGLLSPSGWNNVFYMLMFADACALVFLLRLIHKELSCPGSATGNQAL
ncbi:hypothetical protein J1605_003600 [Eschrichtius robustus]|uniref:Uncharacterized protein n=1 Tax=Eschrichtius robustus TaxID=9764 RepID=A0AB34HL42_ESCRO|nr:hypothetical protein J1605_003600 [Eschrichtius robustus]